MRTVIFGGANSLDNYFARKDDSVDWLMWSDEVAPMMAEFWKTIDTVVMGRIRGGCASVPGFRGGASHISQLAERRAFPHIKRQSRNCP